MHTPFIFLGTPYIARDTLAYLLEHGYVPKLVVTNPDRPQGRGQVLTSSETKIWALEHNLPVITPEKITPEVIAEIESYGCTYAICVAYGKILPETLITIFPKGILNVHYSLLPKYRGASPVESALLHNESMTGVTIQKMVFELDAGDILAREEVPIFPFETTKELRPRLVGIGAKLLTESIPSYLEGTLIPTPQNHAEMTRCGKIAKAEGELHLDDDAIKNWGKYRAFTEGPGTYFFVEKNNAKIRVKITHATLEDESFKVLKVIPEGKKEMDFEVFQATLFN